MTDLDRLDATFHLVKGLASGHPGDLVSFNSRNFGGYYLRHQDYRIKLHEQDLVFAGPGGTMPPERLAAQQLFREDATFIREEGLAKQGGNRVSFRAVNSDNRYLRHRDFHLYVGHIDDQTAREDATFEVVRGFVPAIPIR